MRFLLALLIIPIMVISSEEPMTTPAATEHSLDLPPGVQVAYWIANGILASIFFLKKVDKHVSE